MIMNNESEWNWKEAVVAYIEIIAHHLNGQTVGAQVLCEGSLSSK
jgi:hypothetical protein